MLTKDGSKILCNEPGCDSAINNDRWSKTKASDWFFSKDGLRAYCGSHIPEFVPRWRTKKGKR